MSGEILGIIARECNLETLPPLSASLADLNTDSVDLLCSISALEEHFDIDIPFDGNAGGVETVGEIVTMVEQLVATERRR